MYNCYKKDKNGALELTEITDEIKLAFKKNIARAFIKVLPTDNEEGFEINEDNYLKNIDFDDCRYIESEGIIGTVIAKEISGNFVNVDSYFNLENREIEYYLGVEIDEEVHYLKLGTFIVQKPDNDNVQDNTYFEALDYMVKFNKTFENRISYPCTMKQLLLDICDQVGIECATSNFRNSTFIIENNQFVNGESCREVLKAIAQMAFSWARINEENKLLLDFNLTNDISEEITNDEYITLEINNQFGPINIVTLKNSQIEGEHISIRNEPSISQNGPTELIILDNPFAYTEEKRNQLIDAASALFGFSYVPLTVKTIGYPYLNCQHKIRVKNMQGNLLDTYIFDNKISYNGTITDIKESKAMTKSETKYQYNGTLQAALKRTEIIVDKQEQKITGIVSEIGDRSEKSTTITEDIEGLTVSVQEIAVLNKTVTGLGNITLTNTSKTEISEFKIMGDIKIPVFSDDKNGNYGLVPSADLAPMAILSPTVPSKKNKALYFSDETYLTDMTLIHIKSDNSVERIMLPEFELRTYYNTKDEFVISDGKAKIIRKVGVDNAGFLYTLKEPQIEELQELHIYLTQGNEVFYLEGFKNAEYSATYMVKSELYDNFATKVELNSEIKQTVEEINIGVNKKLEGYSTTTQMNAAINVKAEEVTTAVSKKYETKDGTDKKIEEAKGEIKVTTDNISLEVGKKVNNEDFNGANIMLAINNDTSSAVINADKISLNGKEIDLTSEDIQISSDNFNVDSEGNVEIISTETDSNLKVRKDRNQNTNMVATFPGWIEMAGSSEEGVAAYYYDGLTLYHGAKQFLAEFRETSNGYHLYTGANGVTTSITPQGITTPVVTQTSKEENKKNFERLEDGLEIVKNTDIYKYNLKAEEDETKKHIGFVIGDNYNYSQEITSKNNDGVDTYSMISVAYKAIQEIEEDRQQDKIILKEQQKLIEQLQNEIKELKGEK